MLRAGIYIGWVGFLNLGDEAMYQLCRKRYSSIRWTLTNTLAYTPSADQFVRRGRRNLQQIAGSISEELHAQRRLRALATKAFHRLARLSGREVGMCGGGTYLNRSAEALRTYTEIRKRTGSPVPTFGTGVVHPGFWLSRETGWVDLRREWVDVLAELPVVGVRGPLSKALLDEAGARNIVVCGDPGVAFHVAYANKTIAPPRAGPFRVGLNPGTCSGHLWGREEDVQESLTGLARWLRQAGHEIEIIPVWPKDVASCVDVARRAELDKAVVTSVCCSHEAFLSRMENLDLMVSMKLHAGILAAAANVPFVSLEYRPKCRDFAASLEWEEFLIRTDHLQPDTLIEPVSALMGQLEAKKRELCQKMCRLMNTFENYCCKIEPLLLGSERGGEESLRVSAMQARAISDSSCARPDQVNVREM